ncbi:MAG: NfeD family protein [Candidatus Bipolaricaulota bacterium]|nr:NfeD family protein [Candidatus Bipolaricaulota bacterium]
MRMRILLLGLLITTSFLGLSQDSRSVWVLTIDGEIGRGTVSYLRQGLSEAEEAGAGTLVIEFSTPGGYLDSAVASRDAILDTKIPTIAYVDREAYSAGALLAIACEEIYFAPGGVMGAATPVYFDSGKMEEAPEKIVSATRKLFAAVAETRSRPAEIAEAMVDRDVEIEGLIEKGKLLTLTSQEASQWGYSEGEVGSLEELLEAKGLSGAIVVHFSRRWIDSVVEVLTQSWMAALLITIGMLGLIAEMLIPGFGIPGIVGLTCLGAFFWSHFLVGLAGWESILFLLGGLVAILLEIFVFTAVDFGAAGLGGLVLIGLGFYTSMVGPFTEAAETMQAIGAVSAGLVLALVGTVLLVTRLPKTRLRFGGVILSQAITGKAFDRTRKKGTVSPWLGRHGVAVTDLHPVGTGKFDGERADVVCEEGFLPKGTTIVVTRDDGYRKVVRKKDKEG